jgi:hypothetical protein
MNSVILKYGIPKLVNPEPCIEVQNNNMRTRHIYYSTHGEIDDLMEDIKKWFILPYLEKVSFSEPTFLLNMDKANVVVPLRECPVFEVNANVKEPVGDAPIITLIGDECVIVNKGDTYKDDGATANDTEDGDLTKDIEVISDVDTTTDGNYSVIYRVTDSDGNTVSKTRKVCVVDGSYNHDYDYYWGATRDGECCGNNPNCVYDHEWDYEYC